MSRLRTKLSRRRAKGRIRMVRIKKTTPKRKRITDRVQLMIGTIKEIPPSLKRIVRNLT